MESREAVSVTLSMAATAANLPFLSHRMFLWGPRHGGRALGARLLEFLLLGFVALGIGLMLEQRIGQIHPQGWAFYMAMACFY